MKTVKKRDYPKFLRKKQLQKPAFPKSAASLLALLKVKPKRVSLYGFEHIKQEIRSIAEKSHLTRNEKSVINQTLEGSEVKEIMKALNVTESRVNALKRQAAERMWGVIVQQMSSTQRRARAKNLFEKEAD